MVSGDLDKQRTVGIVLAGHAPLPEALLQAATTILGAADQDWPQIATITIPADLPNHDTLSQVRTAINAVDSGQGVLVLADLFGGSATNTAMANLDNGNVEVVTGASLAMVIEALEKRDRVANAQELAEFTAKAGRGSVIIANALLSKLDSKYLPTNQILA